MKKNEEITTHLPHEESTPQSAPAPAAEKQSAAIMMTSTEGPLLSASIPPGTPLLPGAISQFPQEFNRSKSESDGSDGSGLDLDYDATSSDEEKPAERPPFEETLPLNSQPEHPEPSIQPVQAEQNIQTPRENIQPHSCRKGNNQKNNQTLRSRPEIILDR
jgi:hypothetical protein